MRSLFAKLFCCMLLVPVLARGTGLLFSTTLSEGRPEVERGLGVGLPLLVRMVEVVADRYGLPAAQAIVSAIEGGGRTLLRLEPHASAAGGCSGGGGQSALELPVHLANQPDPACLFVSVLPRRPLFGFLPVPWWTLIPFAELAICVVVSFFLARYLAWPIRRIRLAAAAFAAGDLTARAGHASDTRRDEAADLVEEFDHMAERVSASLQAQQRFIDDVSHEIKSPLARLSMALGLARREVGVAAAPRFDRMERELDTVSRLVSELLVLSSLQGATEPARSSPVELVGLVQEAIDNVTFEWRERAQAISTIRPRGPLWVRGDAALLRRVVENVLVNALFYTPDGTKVEVLLDRTASGAGEWARLVVRDSGPGVPPATLDHLFEAFYRVDAARARNTGGTGLGLAICKRAVELHGGRISAANVLPGLRINVDLPICEGDADTTAISVVAN